MNQKAKMGEGRLERQENCGVHGSPERGWFGKTLMSTVFVFSAVTLLHGANTFPSSGNAGVGTTSPEAVLTIVPGGAGTTTLYGSDYNLGAFMKPLSGRSGYVALTGNDWLDLAGNNAHYLSIFPFDDSANNDDGQWKAFRFRSGASAEDRFWVNKLGEGYFKGKVGIGTSSPSGKLHVYNNTDGAHNQIAVFESLRTGNNVYLKLKNLDYTGGSDYMMFADSYGSVGFVQSGVGNQLMLTQAGNIGIGTSSPNYKLDVYGTIRAKEVIVETGWSDFVFEEGYKLKSLDEVESHIEEHGHLPGVPSASQVASDGLSVGEAQKVMMQKIEELTLYVIDLKKENDALKTKSIEQDQRLSRQETFLSGY